MKDKLSYANSEFFNCNDAVENDLFPDELDEMFNDTDDMNKEVPTSNQLQFNINMANYNYMKHEWGLTDDEWEKWKNEQDIR